SRIHRRRLGRSQGRRPGGDVAESVRGGAAIRPAGGGARGPPLASGADAFRGPSLTRGGCRLDTPSGPDLALRLRSILNDAALPGPVTVPGARRSSPRARPGLSISRIPT